MKSTNIKNVGYLLCLTPQVLLVAGTTLGYPWAPVIFFFLALPLLRFLIGNDQSPPNQKPSPALLFYLHFIPRIYCAGWALILPWSVWIIGTKQMSPLEYVGFALALWIVTSLNTAIGHELIHSRNLFDHKLGRILDASVGYFHFADEHPVHHARNGEYFSNENEGDAAQRDVSVYSFACRRYLRSLRQAWRHEAGRLSRTGKNWLSNRLIYTAIIPITIAIIYFVFSGVVGLLIYAFQIIGSAFTVQAITYLQHWGLTENETPEAAQFAFCWDDGCWMQACVTLNHAYHGLHHLRPSRPYYSLTTLKGGPKLPSSYPVMFVIALFPALFARVMNRRLKSWIDRNREKSVKPLLAGTKNNLIPAQTQH